MIAKANVTIGSQMTNRFSTRPRSTMETPASKLKVPLGSR